MEFNPLIIIVTKLLKILLEMLKYNYMYTRKIFTFDLWGVAFSKTLVLDVYNTLKRQG